MALSGYIPLATLSSSMQARHPTHGDLHFHPGMFTCAAEDCAKTDTIAISAHVRTPVMCLDVLPACRRNPNMRGVGRDYFVRAFQQTCSLRCLHGTFIFLN